MHRWFFSFFLALSLIFASCTSVQTKYARTTSRGVYAIQDSLKAGRVDLAKKYADELTRVVPAPKKSQRVSVRPVEVKTVKKDEKTGKDTVTTQKYLVLPQEYSGTPALTIGTPELTKLTDTHPEIAKQLKEDDKKVESFTKQVDNTQKAIEKEALKPKGGFFSSIFGFIGKWGLFGSIGIVVILIAVAIFAPELLPLIAGKLASLVSSLFKAAGAFIIGLFKKKNNTS